MISTCIFTAIYLQKNIDCIPDDKVPQPLVKHLSSVDVSGKYDDPEGKQAALTSPPSVNGESNLAITQSLLRVWLLYGRFGFVMTCEIPET